MINVVSCTVLSKQRNNVAGDKGSKIVNISDVLKKDGEENVENRGSKEEKKKQFSFVRVLLSLLNFLFFILFSCRIGNVIGLAGKLL